MHSLQRSYEIRKDAVLDGQQVESFLSAKDAYIT